VSRENLGFCPFCSNGILEVRSRPQVQGWVYRIECDSCTFESRSYYTSHEAIQSYRETVGRKVEAFGTLLAACEAALEQLPYEDGNAARMCREAIAKARGA
jgi:hypothetical protein